MDAELVEKFCDITAQLIVPLGTDARTEVAQRDPLDTELVHQLRVAGGGINEALNQLRGSRHRRYGRCDRRPLRSGARRRRPSPRRKRHDLGRPARPRGQPR